MRRLALLAALTALAAPAAASAAPTSSTDAGIDACVAAGRGPPLGAFRSRMSALPARS